MTDILTLTQWLSPSFPVGSFAYSHGLEWAISEGEVSDADGLQEWLSDTLRLGAGRVDAILLCAVRAGRDPTEMAALARALAASKERWEETLAQGRAFCSTVAGMTGEALPELPYPVAVGLAARRLDLPVEEVAALYLHAFASNLVSAGVRFVPLGQTEGQRVLSDLHPLIREVAAQATATEPDDITSFVPRGDFMAMAHETMDVRIYKT
ncbi:MAG: urease accessory protein UreF [Rhodobacteraceae bacterium]|nr:urease accessory protein UreF [Paracoccaceae bacterium]